MLPLGYDFYLGEIFDGDYASKCVEDIIYVLSKHYGFVSKDISYESCLTKYKVIFPRTNTHVVS